MEGPQENSFLTVFQEAQNMIYVRCNSYTVFMQLLFRDCLRVIFHFVFFSIFLETYEYLNSLLNYVSKKQRGHMLQTVSLHHKC